MKETRYIFCPEILELGYFTFDGNTVLLVCDTRPTYLHSRPIKNLKITDIFYKIFNELLYRLKKYIQSEICRYNY